AGPIRVRAEIPCVTRKRVFLNHADLLFDHPAEGAHAERFRDFGRGPSAFGVVRTTEQPNSKAVCVEVHSTRPAELAKACGAALLSSFRCLTPEARITTTLFVKRTTKRSKPACRPRPTAVRG